ncbi:GntR family transcriptional regulator [Enterococcus sp. LJL120]
MTKYEEIAAAIRERIRSGSYPPNQLMPNQTEFVEEFNVSRMTIKKALNLLMNEGLINSQRGSGTRVMSPALWGNSTDCLQKFEYEKLQLSEEQFDLLNISILDFEVQFPNKDTQQQLGISREQPVYYLARLYTLAGKPYVKEDVYIPVSMVPKLTEEIIENSIYRHLVDTLHLRFGGIFKSVYAENSTKEDQKLLAVPNRQSILVTEQVVYLKDSKPIEYSICRSIGNDRRITFVEAKTA